MRRKRAKSREPWATAFAFLDTAARPTTAAALPAGAQLNRSSQTPLPVLSPTTAARPTTVAAPCRCSALPQRPDLLWLLRARTSFMGSLRGVYWPIGQSSFLLSLSWRRLCFRRRFCLFALPDSVLSSPVRMALSFCAALSLCAARSQNLGASINGVRGEWLRAVFNASVSSGSMLRHPKGLLLIKGSAVLGCVPGRAPTSAASKGPCRHLPENTVRGPLCQ